LKRVVAINAGSGIELAAVDGRSQRNEEIKDAIPVETLFSASVAL
jgi:hypothetical protein